MPTIARQCPSWVWHFTDERFEEMLSLTDGSMNRSHELPFALAFELQSRGFSKSGGAFLDFRKNLTD